MMAEPTKARECLLAIETDWQLYQKFTSTAALEAYVQGLVDAANWRYFNDVGVRLKIAYLGIHDNPNDGWDTPDQVNGDAQQLLYEFQNAWTTVPAGAHVAHFLSGAFLGGGIAYLSGPCNPYWSFGVSSGIRGNINWSVWSGQSDGGNWDFVVFTHELGHNFGSFHTHEYCPPPDRCYVNTFPGCNPSPICSHGTIMSYCHTCPGGIANIDLWFAQVCIDSMRGRIGCLPEWSPYH